MERIVLEAGGPRREYLLFVPGSGGSSPIRPPLVVFLHGTGATAAWADDETGWSRLAAREGFALALPQGLPPDPSQPPEFLTNPPRWNDGSDKAEGGRGKGDSEEAVSSGVSPPSPFRPPPSDDVSFITAVIDDSVTRSGADLRRVFVSGFSNGAGMAFRFAAERADRLAAIAPVAGHCWVINPRPARPVPTLYVVGAVDPLVPLRGGEVRNPWQHRYARRPPVAVTLERWAAAVGCEPVPVPESDSGGVRTDIYPPARSAGRAGTIGADLAAERVLFRSVLIDGLGHHWPGGKGQFNRRIAGPPSDTVNGTELVWEFFKSQC